MKFGIAIAKFFGAKAAEVSPFLKALSDEERVRYTAELRDLGFEVEDPEDPPPAAAALAQAA